MAEQPHKPCYSWYILSGSFLIMFLTSGIGLYTFPVFLLPLEEHFGTSRTLLTSLGSLLFLVAGLAAPLIGWAVHHWGARAVIACGACLAGSGYLLLGLASEFWHLLVLGVPVAIGIAAAAHIPNQTLISHWFQRQRGRAMGALMMASALGGIIWAPAAHELITRLHWQGTYAIFGVAILVGTLPVVWLIIRNTPESMGLQHYNEQSDTAVQNVEAENSSAEAGLTVRSILRTRSFWLLFTVQFLYLTGFSIATTHIVAIITNSPLGLDVGKEAAMELGARAISGFLLISIPGALVGGWLADHFTKPAVLVLQFSFFVLATLILYRLDSTPTIYAYVAFFGLALGGSMVVFSLLLLEQFGVQLFSRVMGLMGIAFTLGMATGPILGGIIYDTTESYTHAFSVMLGVFLTCGLLVWLTRNASSS